MALRCEVDVRKNKLAWKWAAVTNLMLDQVAITDVAVARDFAVYLTSTGNLLQCGDAPRRVTYETFLLRPGRRRSRAHAVGVQFKRLSTQEKERQAGHVCDSTCCPLELPMMEAVRVLQVACGATHCVVLGEMGEAKETRRGIYVWGLGEYGQLGLGECQTASTLTPIAAPPELQMLLQNPDENHTLILRCGVFSTYLLSRGSSTLWHWGLLPSAGKDAPFVRQGVPVQFPLVDEHTRLTDVAAGVEHIVLLTESGCVFTWGHGSSGQLGLGPLVTSNVDCDHPTQVDFFRQEINHSIVNISSGWNHTVALSRSGELYAWGSNVSGACGTTSKFCEYFQPVLVAVPRPLELGLTSLDLQAKVCCGGDTSTLLLLRTFSYTSQYSIERAFEWGIGAPGVGVLLPVEMFSFGIEQSKLARCSMGCENSMWLLRNDVCSSYNEASLGWIVNEIHGGAESHQGIEEGLPCLQVTEGSQICVRVQAITKTAAAAIDTSPENDFIDTNLFTLTLQHDDPASTPSEQKTHSQESVSLLSVSRKNQDKRAHVVDIILHAKSTGKTIVSLGNVLGELIGGTFEVNVAPQIEQESGAIAMARVKNSDDDGAINILGIHVEGNVTESQERVDANWYKLQSQQIRVHTNDAVIVLIQSTTNDVDPTVQVESRDNQWQYGITHLDVVCRAGGSRSQNLGVVQLRFPSPGVYFIYDARHHPQDDHDGRSPVLRVSCCLAYEERNQVLAENHGIVWSKYQSALLKAPQSARFSFFLSSVLQHPALRDAVVSSPWASTQDEELSELPFDFDRENDAQRELLQHPENPFILWNSYVATTSIVNLVERPHNRSENVQSLNSILPAWAEPMAAKVAFRIATWLEKPNVSSKEVPNNNPIDFEKARLKATAIGLSVQQTPFDFLGSESRYDVREALAPVNPNIMGVHDSIVSWRRTNGDLFYTVQSNDLRVRRYGHESHDFPETAQSGRITRLRAQLSDFMWHATEGKKIEELFFQLSTLLDPGIHQFEDFLQNNNPCVNNFIHLRKLISHSTALGFDEVAVVLKQEWFALFRSIQALSLPEDKGISFCAFRTFLIDPFHQFFWKQYVHQVREQANSNHEMVTFALEKNFGLSEADGDRVRGNNNFTDSGESIKGGEKNMLPWPDFVESLRSFHSILGLKPLPAAACCRLLYRFDICGNGQISAYAFHSAILHTQDEIDAANKPLGFKNSTKSQTVKSPKAKRPLKVAIVSGHRRPNVEMFTSNEAVHKLFAARAKNYLDSTSPSKSLSGKSTHTRTVASNSINDTASKLRASANTHLARIRNLPISHLLREGIYFRPPRRYRYRSEDEREPTQTQRIGAEDSY